MEKLYVLFPSVLSLRLRRKLLLTAVLDDDAKAPAAKHLAKWRPHILESEGKTNTSLSPNTPSKSEGIQEPSVSSLPHANAASAGEGEQMNANQGALPVAAAG